MHSCIYEGRVEHTRTAPARHQFSYRLFMMYLDLDELDEVFRKHWFWSARRPALASFRREDHLGPATQDLGAAVRDRVEAETGQRPEGCIRLLTNLSYFGYCFNPVSFYYCYAADGETVEYIVCEVNNTPWGERDTYVLDCSKAESVQAHWDFRPGKKMHVSPFMPMDVDYHWVLSNPAERLSVFMANLQDGERMFSVAMRLEQKAVTGWSLSSVLLRFPLQTMKVIFAIYWQALRLWLKRCPVYPHPGSKKKAVV